MLRRCLERDPANRLHDAADARLVIADVQREGPVVSRTSSRRRLRRTYVGAFALAVTIVAVWVGIALTRPPPIGAANPIVRFAIEPPAGVATISNVTLAADGRFIVYEGQVEGESRLFLRRLDALDSRLLAGTEGARWPFISPDGAWVGFFRDAKIYKVSTDGGDALAVCDVRGGPGATWDAHGQIIFSRTWLSGLSIVTADGGTPRVLTNPDATKQEIGHWWPSMLPDGRALFTVVTASTGLNDARIGLLDPRDGTYRVLFAGARATWLPSGHIVFYRTGRYHAVAFDLTAGKAVGASFPVLDDAQELDPAGDWQQPMASTPGGALAYLAGPYVPPSRLTWIDVTGALKPLPFAARPFVSVKLSPDGRHAATGSMESGRLLIRLYDLERGIEDMPNFDGMNWNPTWLPDGRLSFTSMRKGDFDVYVKDLGSARAESALLAGSDDTDPVAWTRDGRLVFQGSEPDGAYPLKLYDPGHVPQTTRLTEQHVENGGSLSPDDRWLAYHTAASGRPVIYVRPLDGPGPAVGLSRSAAEFPVFLRDGKSLAFIQGQELVVVPWRDRDGVFETGAERAVVHLAFGSGWTYGAPYDAVPGGRFLALVRTEVSPPPRIRVVLGWDQEVTRTGQRTRIPNP
jgi:serine/threonine-protein kinase